MQSSTQNRLQDYTSPNNTAFTYLNSNTAEAQSANGWNMIESSSSGVQNLVNHNEQKVEPVWASSMSVASGVHSIFRERHNEPSSVYSLNGVNLRNDRIARDPTFLHNSSSGFVPRNLNINEGSGEQGIDDCQIVECPPIFKSTSSVNARLPSGSSSSNPIELNVGGYVEGSDGRAGNSLEGHHLSRKRKVTEGHIGQSSGSGSSNYFRHTEDSAWHVVPPQQSAGNTLSISSASENTIGTSQLQHLNPTFQLGVGGVASESPPALSAGASESSHRNLRLRFSSSHQVNSLPNHMFAAGTSVGGSNYSSPHLPQTVVPLSSPLDMLSPAATSTGVPQGQSLLAPVMHRNLQSSRWNRSSSSRTGSSSSSATLVNNRDVSSHAEVRSRTMQRNILEHPMFIPASEMRNSAPSQSNLNITGGNSIVTNIGSSSGNGPTTGAHPSSAPNVVRSRSSSQYSRRLSELVRRSLMSSSVPDSTMQITNPPVSTQGIAISSGDQGHQLSHARSTTLLDRATLLNRHLDGPFGIPHSLRTLAAAGEGRSRILSEIRNALDQMRRGEGLRFEDVMMLDPSVLFGMADVHDRYRDMRLDVDNMSYEELLALEDRIGYVNTGLSEEAILKCLKKRKYAAVATDQKESEPCCICQDEYIDGDNLGKLDCGHDFHADCVKQWLTQKSWCPICKTTMDTKEKS